MSVPGRRVGCVVVMTMALALHPTSVMADDPQTQSAVVHADAMTQDVERVEGAVGFATSIDTRERGPQVESLGDLLEEAPGLHVRRQGDGFAPETVTLRGAPASQVTVALDGVVLNDAVSDGVDLALIPPSLLERVDVYRGSAPIRLGVSGLGGAIEVITRRLPSRPIGQVTVGGGSFGARRVNGFTGARYGRLSVLAALGYRGTNGDFTYYDQANGPLNPGVIAARQNNAAASGDGLARACYEIDDQTHACVLLVAGWRSRQIAGPAGLLTVGPYVESGRLLARASLRMRRGSTVGEVYASAVTRDDHFSNQGPDPLQGTSTVDARSTTWSTELGATSTVHTGLLTTQFIARGRAERYVPHFTGIDDNASRQGVLGGVETSLDLGALSLTPAAGIEAMADHGPAGTGSRTLASPRVALRVRLAPWIEVRATAGHYERAPSLPELYGDRGVIVGNPLLLPETSDNVDAGAVLSVHRGASSLRVEASAYARRVENLITLVQTNRSTYTPYNIARATIEGGELGIRYVWSGTLRAALAYALVNPITPAPDGTDRRVPGISTHDFFASVDGTVGPVSLGADVSFVSATFLDVTNTAAIPSRVLVGARGTLEIPGARWLAVHATVTNLLDVRTGTMPLPIACTAANPSACEGTVPIQDFFGYPLPGRAIFVSLTARTESRL